MYEIYSPALERLGEIEAVSSDNHSLHWQEAGSLALIAVATARNLQLLQTGRFLLVRDTLRHAGRLDGLYLLCNVAHDEEKSEVTVNGRSALFLLHQRAAGDTVFTDTTAGAALAGLVNGNVRTLPVEAAAESSGDPAVVRYPVSGGAVDEQCGNLMTYCGIGHGAELDGKTVRLTFSPGRDISDRADTAIIGSCNGRARNASIGVDISDYCNTAVGTLVFSSGTEEPFYFGADGLDGLEQRELYVGAIQQASGEGDADFRRRAEQEARDKLLSHLLRTTVTADISPADYGRPYLVGDIVRVQVGSVTLRKRIISAAWLRDQNQDKLTLTMGEQLNTIVAEVKEQTKQASARAGGAAKAAEENAEKIAGILTDYKSLFAQVTDLVAGMDAYVLNKVFEDYKYAVAHLFAAMQEQDEQLMAELTVKVSTGDLKKELQNYALAASLADYLTVKAASELYVTGDDVDAIIGAYIVTDEAGNKSTIAAIANRVADAEVALQQTVSKKTFSDAIDSQDEAIAEAQEAVANLSSRVGNAEASLTLKAETKTVTALDGRVTEVSSSVAELSADVIKLQGRVDLSGNVSVSNGQLTVLGPLVAAKSFQIGGGDFYISGKKYAPAEITSTTGAVFRALGA